MKAMEVLNSMADALVDLAGAAYEQWAVALTGYREAIQERRQRQIADRATPVSEPAQQYMVDTSASEKRTPDLISVGEPASSINPAFIIATNRQHLVCPVDLSVNQEGFMEAVEEESQSLGLPFSFDFKTVKWDIVDLDEPEIVVLPTVTPEIAFLLRLEYIGRVAFITQRTYLVPFRPPVIKESSTILIAGVVTLVVSLLLIAWGSVSHEGQFGGLGALGVLISLALFFANSQVAPNARKQAEKEWVESVRSLFVRGAITDETNSLGTALEEAVRAAVDKLFVQHGAQLEAAERQKKTQAELDEEIQKQSKKFYGG